MKRFAYSLTVLPDTKLDTNRTVGGQRLICEFSTARDTNGDTKKIRK